jgi:hypothetical protein
MYPLEADSYQHPAAECELLHEVRPWSLMVALAQAVFRAVLYSDLDFESSPWDTLSADAKHFVQALLNREADQRPTALEALHFK